MYVWSSKNLIYSLPCPVTIIVHCLHRDVHMYTRTFNFMPGENKYTI